MGKCSLLSDVLHLNFKSLRPHLHRLVGGSVQKGGQAVVLLPSQPPSCKLTLWVAMLTHIAVIAVRKDLYHSSHLPVLPLNMIHLAEQGQAATTLEVVIYIITGLLARMTLYKYFIGTNCFSHLLGMSCCAVKGDSSLIFYSEASQSGSRSSW